MRRFALLAALLAAARPGPAYVTSAVLEFLVDDTVAFFLNGSMVLERSRAEAFSYQVLSTADGNLPLELFREQGENVLAAANYNPVGGHMGLAFRLTVHQSDGDPVRVWSDPSQTRLLHLKEGDPEPAGWQQLDFDDGAWPQGLGVRLVDTYTRHPTLEEPSLAGFFGGGFVPFLTHQSNARGNSTDRNLIRSRFRFPVKASKVQVKAQPEGAAQGQAVQVQLVPGPDLAMVPQFNVLAWLPQGLQLAGASSGARWDAQLRRLDWSFSSRDMAVGYLNLHADKVLAAPGWSGAEKVLGPPKDKGRGWVTDNIPQAVLDDGAVIAHGGEGWFSLGDPDPGLEAMGARIQGVMIHVQLRPGGTDMGHKLETDRVFLNYSVDGSRRGALPQDVDIMRMSDARYWFQAYHHASEERAWTWADLRNLAVMLRARAVGNRDRNLAASIRVAVRYYVPGRVAPSFSAVVQEARCADLPLQAGTFRQGTRLVSADPFPLKVNAHLCAPTPVPPPPTPTPALAQIRLQPTPTPVPTGLALGALAIGLGCLEARPEPMDYAGTFLGFCLKVPARVTVNVYGAAGGAPLRSLDAGDYRAGEGHQVFFSGLDASGRMLGPGTYAVEFVAQAADGRKEARNMSLRVVRKREGR